MITDEIRQAIIDGCSAGQGLEFICASRADIMPTLDQIRRGHPEIAQFYLDQKQKWASSRGDERSPARSTIA